MAIRDSPIREEGGKAALAGINHGFRPTDIEVGVLLAGKGGVREVLGGGGRTDRNIDALAVFLFHFVVGADDRLAQVGRELGGADDISRFGTALLEVTQIVGVQPGQGVANGGLNPRLFEEVAIGKGGDGVPIGHRHPLRRQLLMHFTQGSILAAHYRHILDANVIKPENKCCFVLMFHLVLPCERKPSAGPSPLLKPFVVGNRHIDL